MRSHLALGITSRSLAIVALFVILSIANGSFVSAAGDTKATKSGLVEGRVVLKDKPEHGVANAKIDGSAIDENNLGRSFDAVTAADGTFQAIRGPFNMVIHAASPDGKLAGIVKIGPDDATLTIPIGP